MQFKILLASKLFKYFRKILRNKKKRIGAQKLGKREREREKLSEIDKKKRKNRRER